MTEPTPLADAGEAKPVITSPSRPTGRIPLEFWLGPFLLLRLRLHVCIENFFPKPDEFVVSPAPDLTGLPSGAHGLYRRSQPLAYDVLPPTVSGWIAYVVDRHDRRLIHLRQSFEDYIRHFSRKARIRVKGEVRRFSEAAGGTINWRTYKTIEEVQEFHELARDISQHTYQEKLFNKGMPAGPKAREAILKLAAADEVRGYILFWGELPISYVYCPAVGNRLRLGYLGFRPEFARHSPGTVLMFLAVESLFAEQRFDLMDLGEGGEGLHKRVFATHTVPCAHILYLRRTIGNLLMVAGHRGWLKFSKAAVDLVDRIGAKQRLRQWIRGQRSSAASAESHRDASLASARSVSEKASIR